jgi:hypothetical protein
MRSSSASAKKICLSEMRNLRFGHSLVWFGYRRYPLFSLDLVHHEIIFLGLTLEWETDA